MAIVVAALPLAWAQGAVRAGSDTGLWTGVLLASALVVALLAAGRPRRETAIEVPAGVREARGVPLLRVGLLVLLAAAVGLAVAWRRLFAADVALLIAGVWMLSRGLRQKDGEVRGAGPPGWTRRDTLLVAAVAALALVLRLAGLDRFPDPYGVFAIEEPQTGMGGYLILRGDRPWEFVLDHYLAAAALLVGGRSLPVVRAPFAVFSALTVVPLYLLLRQLVSRDAAGFGAVLLAVSGWHLSYARCAHNIFLPTVAVVLVLALLVHGERTHRSGVYPWIGLLVAVTLFSYAGYRGTVVFVALFFASVMIGHLYRARAAPSQAARGQELLRLRRDLSGAGWVALVVMAVLPALVVRLQVDPRPGYSYFEAASRSLANREYYTSDLGEFLRLRTVRLREAAAIFIHHGDDSPTFNVPGEPMLDPVTASFALTGFLYAACFPWRQYNAFFVIMALALFAVGTVFVQNLDVRRLQGLIPLVCVFAALMADRIVDSARGFGRRGVRVARAILVASAVLAAAANAYGFFGRLWQHPEVRRAFLNEHMELIRLARTRLAGRYLVLLTDQRNFFAGNDYSWLSGRIAGHVLPDLTSLWAGGPLPQSAESPTSIVVAPPFDATAIGTFIGRLFPRATCWTAEPAGAQDLTIFVCDFPAGEVRPVPVDLGLHARYVVGADGTSVERREPFVSEAVFPPVCRTIYTEVDASECTAHWTGTFSLARETVVEILPRVERGAMTVDLDGTPVSGPRRLGAGEHVVSVRAHFPREGPTGIRLHWRVDGGAPALMPFYYLPSGG